MDPARRLGGQSFYLLVPKNTSDFIALYFNDAIQKELLPVKPLSLIPTGRKLPVLLDFVCPWSDRFPALDLERAGSIE